jgi:hypothetical protein
MSDLHDARGVLLLASDDSMARADAVAERWLVELRESSRGRPLPPVVAAVASRARSMVDRRAAVSAVARARSAARDRSS